MRIVNITKDQFDNFLFPVWANAQQPGDPEVVIRITKKLKKVSEELPPTDAQKAAMKAGRKVYFDRVLSSPSAALYLEEDERNVLRDAFKDSLKNFNPFAMEDAYELYELLRDARPEDEVNVSPAEPEVQSE